MKLSDRLKLLREWDMLNPVKGQEELVGDAPQIREELDTAIKQAESLEKENNDMLWEIHPEDMGR